MADAPRVFISYNHDSDEHAARVLALADALCDGGIDVILDRYVHPAPPEGWPRWMDQNLDEAKFVLMVCTETYRRRVMGQEETGKGLGVRWEGSLIYSWIYNDKLSALRFIPILLLPGSDPAHIPNPVQGHTYYRLTTFDLNDPGYEALYRHLTDQPATPKPDVPSIKILPPKPRPQRSPDPLPTSAESCDEQPVKTTVSGTSSDVATHQFDVRIWVLGLIIALLIALPLFILYPITCTPRTTPTPTPVGSLDGTWESRSGMDPKLNGRFALTINDIHCILN